MYTADCKEEELHVRLEARYRIGISVIIDVPFLIYGFSQTIAFSNICQFLRFSDTDTCFRQENIGT